MSGSFVSNGGFVLPTNEPFVPNSGFVPPTNGGSPATVAAKFLLVIAGQSNALGQMVAASVTNYPGIASTYPAVQFIEQSSVLSDPPPWGYSGPRDLGPRVSTVGGQVAGTAGVELSLGRYLAENTPNTWAIAKMAIDGSGLENQWINGAYPATGGSLLAQFTAFITAQLTAFDAELGAIVWIQGEADSTESPDAANYLANLTTLFSSLRTTFGEDFKIVMSRLSSNYANGGGVFSVRSAEESYAAADSRARVVPGDDLPFRDTAHYTDDAYVTLGLRLGAEVAALTQGTAQPSPRWSAAGVPVVATSSGALTPTWPSHAVGDLGFLVVSALGANNYATPAGWTALASSPQRDASSSLNSRLQVWYKVASSSAESAPTIADIASDDAKIGVIVTVRGGSAIDATAGDAIGTASTAVSVPGLTTTADGALVLAFAAHRIDVGTARFSGWVNADLVNVTEQLDYSTTTGVGYGLAVVTGTKAVAGVVGATTGVLAAASTQARISVAVNP